MTSQTGDDSESTPRRSAKKAKAKEKKKKASTPKPVVIQDSKSETEQKDLMNVDTAELFANQPSTATGDTFTTEQ